MLDSQQLHDRLVGTWRCEMRGLTEETLSAVPAETADTLVLRKDGTAAYYFGNDPHRYSMPDASFDATWEVGEPGMLYIWIPIAPMRDIGHMDWTRDAMIFPVDQVHNDTMLVNTKRADGEALVLYRQVASTP